jgi:Flp pilus assembly pilin Flp
MIRSGSTRDHEGGSMPRLGVGNEEVDHVVRETTSEGGQVLVEYSLVLGLIVAVCIALLSAVGDRALAMLSHISGTF